MNNGFTSIKVRNYKSFRHLNFDLSYRNSPNKMIAIYGANGSGKSNIVSLFSSLSLSIKTLVKLDKYTSTIGKDIDPRAIYDIGTDRDIHACFPYTYYSKGSKGPMSITYGFRINGHKGEYTLVFSSPHVRFNLITHTRSKVIDLLDEKLKFTINTRIGKMFEIKRIDNKRFEYYINNRVFKTKLLRNTIRKLLRSLWGSQTMLAIFSRISSDENSNLVNDTSKNFLEVYKYFNSISFRSDANNRYVSLSGYYIHPSFYILRHLNNGYLPDNKKSRILIRNTENALNGFFKPLYDNLICLRYKKIPNNEGRLTYSLYSYEKLNSKNVFIPFRWESHGTKRLLRLFIPILDAINGDTVVIDEIDQGIHDILMNRLIYDINKNIKGQLIFTTHDTFLMTKLSKQSLYVIQVDPFGNKRIAPVYKAVKGRIYKNNNIQKMYLNGFLDGIPYLGDISFPDILRKIRKDH